MPITKGQIQETFFELLSFCRGRWKKTQSAKVCSRAAHTMKTELMEKGSNINSQNVAAAANKVDQDCAKFSKDNKRVCAGAVATFIRRLSSRNPGLKGRR